MPLLNNPEEFKRPGSAITDSEKVIISEMESYMKEMNNSLINRQLQERPLNNGQIKIPLQKKAEPKWKTLLKRILGLSDLSEQQNKKIRFPGREKKLTWKEKLCIRINKL